MANDIKIIVQYETATKAKKEIKDLGTVTLRLDQTQKKNSSTSAKLASTTQKLSKATKVQSSANHQLANSYKAVGGAAMVGGKKMNTFNMRIQQGGYQLQDFAVQMQSGTSFFTAFSQQGSQFAGIFGPTGAVIGAVIAIASGIGGIALKSWQASQDLRTMEEALEDVASASGDIQDAVNNLNSLNSNGNLTSASTAMISIAESAKVIAQTEFEQSLGSFVDNLDQKVSKLGQAVGLVKGLAKGLFAGLVSYDKLDLKVSDKQLADINFDKLGLSVDRSVYEGARGAIKRAFEGDDLKSQLKALEKLQNVLAPTTEKGGKLTATLPESDKGKELLGNTRALIAILNTQVKAEQKIVDFKNEEVKAIARGHVLRQTELEFGKDSVEYQREVNKQAVSRYETRLKLAGLNDKDVAYFVKQRKWGLESEISLRREIQIKKDKLKQDELSEKERARLEKELARLEKKKQADEDKLNALKGKNLANYLRGKYRAERLAKEAAEKAEQELRDLRSNSIATLLSVKYQAIVKIKEEEKRAEEELHELRLSNMQDTFSRFRSLQQSIQGRKSLAASIPESLQKKYKARAGSEEVTPEEDPKVKELSDYIDELRNQKNVETELVGLFGSERDIKQKILDVQNKYKDVIDENQVKEIERVLRLTDAETKRHEALEKAKQEQEALGASIEASMEKAFMSMVDGTASVKDAFKSMAREIIAELYKVLVVKKAVAAISGALGFADGGVISSGSQVQAYADGGVVSSPTTFGMSGGKTGLMGEAGPEAIMPLKRGANGKLGVQMEGGGATTVVQNFNFSANGDDSVKRIIAQAAPKIAEMTKSQIVNDRKRGGSMKAAFG